jgi:toxin-antitoxin system PIN domain toxin
MTPDVNVLIAASRRDHPHHAVAAAWFASTAASATAGSLLLFPMVLASFVRLVIHPKIFAVPSSLSDAIVFVDALLAAPGARMPELGAEWPRFRALCMTMKLKANDIPDAWLAAAVREHGDHLVTFDAGFRRLLKRSELTLLV